jgi:hypothetical protein
MSRFPISSGRAKPPASIRIDGGGYRRDHLRALAQRVEVADREVRIIGSKSTLLRTLAAAGGIKPATLGVRSSVLSWRRTQSQANCSPAKFPAIREKYRESGA